MAHLQFDHFHSLSVIAPLWVAFLKFCSSSITSSTRILFWTFLMLYFFFWKRLQCTTDKDLVWNIVRHLSTLIENPNPGRWDGGLIFPLMYHDYYFHVFLFFVFFFHCSWIMKRQREYSELYLFYPLEQKWKKIPREQQNIPNTALVIIHSPLTPIHLSQKLCLINI